MADPTCHNCPPDKRVERYPQPVHDRETGQVTRYVQVVRCIECGNQLVDDQPAESPNMPTVFEETVSGGQRVNRKRSHGPRAGAVATDPNSRSV